MLFRDLRAQSSRYVLLTLAVCTLASPFAWAQTEAMPAVKPSFATVGEWSVGTTQISNVRGLKGLKLPCVVSNEYDNGFVVRFSGGGGKLFAMAMDFRQDVFKRGRKYNAMVTIGDSYIKQVQATAFAPNTLIFNLRPVSDIYDAVKSAESMEISINGNDFVFSLRNLNAALPQFEACYKGEYNAPEAPPMQQAQEAVAEDTKKAPSAPSAVVAEPLPVIPPAPIVQPIPKNLNDIIAAEPETNRTADLRPPAPSAPRAAVPVAKAPDINDRASPIPGRVSKATPVAPASSNISAAQGASLRPEIPKSPPVPAAVTPLPLSPAASSMPRGPETLPQQAEEVQPQVWTAKAGEDLKIVLSRWAERAGYDLEWQSDQDGEVVQDIQVKGTFEDAVAQVMAENSAATGIAGKIASVEGDVRELPKTSSGVVAPRDTGAPTKAIIPALHSDWNAPAGANIQTILDQWARKADIEIVWQDYMTFALKQPININGSFEEAAQTLLDQFESDKQRPVAQLNIDPDTGKRTLLMSTEAND